MVRDHGALYNPLPRRATSLRCSHPHCHARLTGRVLHAALQRGIQALSHTWCAIKAYRTTKSTTWTTTQGSTAFHAWSLACTSSLIPSPRKLDLVKKEGQEQKKRVMKRRCAVTNTRTVEFAVLMATQLRRTWKDSEGAQGKDIQTRGNRCASRKTWSCKEG